MGNATFTSTIGYSVIDLCFCNQKIIKLIKSLQVVSFPYSAHFPLLLSIGNTSPVKLATVLKLKWDTDKQKEFQKKLNESLSVMNCIADFNTNTVSYTHLRAHETVLDL